MNNLYYKSDFRFQMMLIALLQMIGMLMMPVAIGIIFFDWKIGLVVGILGGLMYWKFGDLNVTLGHKWSRFSGEKQIDAPILYCEIENPETAGKFRWVAENIGGLFREGEDIVLGSLDGEVRCRVEELHYEVVNKNVIVNYIIVKFPSASYALFAKWDGKLSEQPTSPQTAKWAADIIDQLISGQHA